MSRLATPTSIKSAISMGMNSSKAVSTTISSMPITMSHRYAPRYLSSCLRSFMTLPLFGM